VPNIQLLQRIVSRRPGVSLLATMQGLPALDLARAHRPGLILLDLHLPDVSGDEVLARLRQDPETKEIPVVILSADATPARQRVKADHSIGIFTLIAPRRSPTAYPVARSIG